MGEIQASRGDAKGRGPSIREESGWTMQMGPGQLLFPLQGDLQRTNIQLDFKDGIAVSLRYFSPVRMASTRVQESRHLPGGRPMRRIN